VAAWVRIWEEAIVAWAWAEERAAWATAAR